MDMEVRKGSEEYKERFIKHLVEEVGIDRDMAEAEYEAGIEKLEDEISHPETDADMAISYWDE